MDQQSAKRVFAYRDEIKSSTNRTLVFALFLIGVAIVAICASKLDGLDSAKDSVYLSQGSQQAFIAGEHSNKLKPSEKSHREESPQPWYSVSMVVALAIVSQRKFQTTVSELSFSHLSLLYNILFPRAPPLL